jgi:hypothetical protein
MTSVSRKLAGGHMDRIRSGSDERGQPKGANHDRRGCKVLLKGCGSNSSCNERFAATALLLARGHEVGEKSEISFLPDCRAPNGPRHFFRCRPGPIARSGPLNTNKDSSRDRRSMRS